MLEFMPLQNLSVSKLASLLPLIIVVLSACETLLWYNNAILFNPVHDRLKFLTLVRCLEVFSSNSSPLTCAVIQQVRCKISVAGQRLMQRRDAVISMLSSNCRRVVLEKGRNKSFWIFMHPQSLSEYVQAVKVMEDYMSPLVIFLREPQPFTLSPSTPAM